MFIRMYDGAYSFVSNTLYGLTSPVTHNGPSTCPTSGNYSDNRFINMTWGPYLVGDGCRAAFTIGPNVYDTITNDAIYISGDVSTTTNVGSALFVHSDSRNVGGYGVHVVSAARGHYVRSATYGNSPTGALGDIGLESTAYSSDFLLTFAAGYKTITDWVYGSQVRIVGTP